MVQIYLFVFLSLSPKSLLSISFSAFSNLLLSASSTTQLCQSLTITHSLLLLHIQQRSLTTTIAFFTTTTVTLFTTITSSVSLSFSLLSVESEFIYFGKGRWRRQRRLIEDEVAETVARELSRLED